MFLRNVGADKDSVQCDNLLVAVVLFLRPSERDPLYCIAHRKYRVVTSGRYTFSCRLAGLIPHLSLLGSVPYHNFVTHVSPAFSLNG